MRVYELACERLASPSPVRPSRPGGEEEHGRELMPPTDRLAGTIRGRKKTVLFAGAALAAVGAGTASAVAVGTSASSPHASAPVRTHVQAAAPSRVANRPQPKTRQPAGPAQLPTHQTAARTVADMPASSKAATKNPAPQHPATAAHTAAPHAAQKPAAQPKQPAAAHHAKVQTAHKSVSWGAVSGKLNRQTNPAAARHGEVPAADKLTPVATSGPQQSMPITSAQYANAKTIVHQALAKRMGLRSAVIAVATAMQESQLVNVSYGTGASMGLFQQQIGMGWGTAAQVMNPSYAANPFLDALRVYQAQNPHWASEPLYQAAQGVQKSAFPTAYAKWEAQSAHLVRSIVMQSD